MKCEICGIKIPKGEEHFYYDGTTVCADCLWALTIEDDVRDELRYLEDIEYAEEHYEE